LYNKQQKKSMPSHLIYRELRLLLLVALVTFFRFRIKGKHNIPKKGSFIVAGNHTSYLDPIAVGVSMPMVVHFIAKEELVGPGLFGSVMSKIGMVPVKRGSQDVGVIKESLKYLRQGQVVGIFPEGGRVETPGFGEPRLGIGMLAAHSKVPVLPMYVKGTENLLSKRKKFGIPERIEARIGEPLEFKEDKNVHHKKDMYKEFSDKVMKSIANLKSAYEIGY